MPQTSFLLLQPSILDTMAPHCAKKVFRADNKMKFYNNSCWDWLTKKFRKEVEKFAFNLHIIKVKGLAFDIHMIYCSTYVLVSAIWIRCNFLRKGTPFVYLLISIKLWWTISQSHWKEIFLAFHEITFFISILNCEIRFMPNSWNFSDFTWNHAKRAIFSPKIPKNKENCHSQTSQFI